MNIKAVLTNINRFIKGARRYRAFYEKLLLTLEESRFSLKDKEKIGVVVSPWVLTATPWYAITIALLLKAQGKNVSIIWDDLPFFNLSKLQNKEIKKVLSKIKGIKIIRLSLMKAQVNNNREDEQEIGRLAKLNSTWKLRESYRTNQFNQLLDKYKKILIRNSAIVKRIVFDEDHGIERFIVPGGIVGNTGLYIFYAKKLNKRVSTYDSGNGISIIGINDVAAHQTDIIDILKNTSIESVDCVIKLATEEFEKRLMSKDHFSFQVESYNTSPEVQAYDVIIPLNIAWDSAALGKHRFFDNTHQWVTETVDYILSNTKLSVVVRQHPAERYFNKPLLEESLIEVFGKNRNFSFISCNDKVNSYKLLEKSKIILPHTSTAGIESAILGKKVIMESDAYYSHLSFVERANSKENYFAKIKYFGEQKAIEKLTEEQVKEAWLCYYFSQICNRISTTFTPQPQDFNRWVSMNVNELMAENGFNITIESLKSSLPVAYLIHKQNNK